ncbi:hypothetical protein ACIA8R_08870 [Nonomuraea sp. NPDC051191]|uniref:hypothetical protein n=1 Tax=Nonomuraea sp. NPDC051191 TaxID=3364372 RepID=UPI003796407A
MIFDGGQREGELGELPPQSGQATGEVFLQVAIPGLDRRLDRGADSADLVQDMRDLRAQPFGLGPAAFQDLLDALLQVVLEHPARGLVAVAVAAAVAAAVLAEAGNTGFDKVS